MTAAPTPEADLTLPDLGEPWIVMHRDAFVALMRDRQAIIDEARAERQRIHAAFAWARADRFTQLRESSQRRRFFGTRRAA